MVKSVGSTKDLKPIRRSRVSFILLLRPSPEAAKRIPEGFTPGVKRPGAGRCRIGAENESSGLRAQPGPAKLSKPSRWRGRQRGAGGPKARSRLKRKTLILP